MKEQAVWVNRLQLHVKNTRPNSVTLTYMSVCVCVCVCLSVCLSVCLWWSVCLSVCPGCLENLHRQALVQRSLKYFLQISEDQLSEMRVKVDYCQQIKYILELTLLTIHLVLGCYNLCLSLSLYLYIYEERYTYLSACQSVCLHLSKHTAVPMIHHSYHVK